eukprot:7060518-Prymnesium_polylepis.1
MERVRADCPPSHLSLCVAPGLLLDRVLCFWGVSCVRALYIPEHHTSARIAQDNTPKPRSVAAHIPFRQGSSKLDRVLQAMYTERNRQGPGECPVMNQEYVEHPGPA